MTKSARIYFVTRESRRSSVDPFTSGGDLPAARWVVPSACDTASGDIVDSEGVLGLRRAAGLDDHPFWWGRFVPGAVTAPLIRTRRS